MKSNLPPLAEISGAYSGVYEAWYNQMDPRKLNCIGAMEAASFLKKSGLPDGVLGQIWDLADPNCKGSLDKTGLFVAMKMVALAQNSKPVAICNVRLNVPPPNMGSPPPVAVSAAPAVPAAVPVGGIWTMSSAERQRYQQIFNSLGPENGRLAGNKVREVLINSKLPVDKLGKIWDLSDLDKDGLLDDKEFNIAMHLVYRALESHVVPDQLPAGLLASARSSPAAQAAVIDTQDSLFAPAMPVQRWVVSAADKARYDVMFRGADLDRDGYVSGAEIKDLFLKSGLPQLVLAHIWSLCDVRQTGKLNTEQFALAMYLVEQKLKGHELPAQLSDDMVPPTLRPKPGSAPQQQPPAPKTDPTYSNPELQAIYKEIQALVQEQEQLQTDINQKESQLQGRNSEASTLQREHETLSATLKQLEGQRGAAQNKLDDLALQVEKLSVQVNDQESSLQAEEKELTDKRNELNKLRDEEHELEERVRTGEAREQRLVRVMEDLVLQISQAKSKTTILEECQSQLLEALELCCSALDQEDPALVVESCLTMPDMPFNDPMFSDIRSTLSPEPTNSPTPPSHHSPEHAQPPPRPASPFGHRPADVGSSSSALHDDAFRAPAVQSDPFSAWEQTPTTDSGGAAAAATADFDAFGADPFLALRPPSRATPEPPQHKKAPPPRPAPPKNAPARPPPPSFNKKPAPAAVGFADFANFDQFASSAGSSSSVSAAAVDPWSPVVSDSQLLNQQSADPVAVAVSDPFFSQDPFSSPDTEDPFSKEDPFSGEDPFSSSDPFSGSDPFGSVDGLDSGVGGDETPVSGVLADGKRTESASVSTSSCLTQPSAAPRQSQSRSPSTGL